MCLNVQKLMEIVLVDVMLILGSLLIRIVNVKNLLKKFVKVGQKNYIPL